MLEQLRRVYPTQEKELLAVAHVLKRCGENMLKTEGLPHWLPPYPLPNLRRDCAEHEVFLLTESGAGIHTFQLRYPRPGEAALHKFATLPEWAGQGIGRQSLDWMERHIRKQGITRLCLEVYERSERALTFYLHTGFLITGTRRTGRFQVFCLQKELPNAVWPVPGI